MYLNLSGRLRASVCEYTGSDLALDGIFIGH